MSMIYLGFTVDQMINFLNSSCRDFALVTNDTDEIKGDFRLTVYSDEHGEYEGFGSLSRVVIEAFKPFIDKAKSEREKNRDLLNKTLGIPRS